MATSRIAWPQEVRNKVAKSDKQIECESSNCLFFAVGRWWNRGGYLVIRKSRFGWFPHFFWSSDLESFESYTPIIGGRSRWFPPLLFRGYIKHDEGAEAPQQN